MPPIGPMLPSGLIIPVITKFLSIVQFSSKEIVASVITAPADGPPMIGAEVRITKK